MNQADLDSSNKLEQSAALLPKSIIEAFNSATDLTYVSCKVKPPLWDTPAVKESRRDMITKDYGYNKTEHESR